MKLTDVLTDMEARATPYARFASAYRGELERRRNGSNLSPLPYQPIETPEQLGVYAANGVYQLNSGLSPGGSGKAIEYGIDMLHRTGHLWSSNKAGNLVKKYLESLEPSDRKKEVERLGTLPFANKLRRIWEKESAKTD